MGSNFFHQLPPFIEEGMTRFDELYLEALDSVSPTISRGLTHIASNAGKRIRPLILMLVASSYTPLTDRIINGAVFVELLHVATLIHDDVVDMSLERRGAPSTNALLGNQKAVLFGDYILANAIMQAVMTEDLAVVGRLARLGRVLSEGELLQADVAELGNYSENEYFQIIDRKTASLIVASAEIGLILAGQRDSGQLHLLSLAAEKLGLAFQIKDDIFDYLPTPQLGKPGGNDLREHKVTLPLIYALNSGRKEALKAQKTLRHNVLSHEQITYLIDFAIRNGGIEYAEEKMQSLLAESKTIFTQVLPQGESLEQLLLLCDYVGQRKK